MDSDPDIEFIDKDSGMSSLVGSKDETPERRALIVNEKTHFCRSPPKKKRFNMFQLNSQEDVPDDEPLGQQVVRQKDADNYDEVSAQDVGVFINHKAYLPPPCPVLIST